MDLGCGDGLFTTKIAKILGVKEVHGVDVNYEALNIAKSRGLNVLRADLNLDDLPYENEFDVVTAFEVIEHLYNTDNLIRQAYRALRPGGYFILTTPNLASWINRLLMLFGYLPYLYDVSLNYQLEKRPLQRSSSNSYQHLRLYTFKTLHKHLEIWGFKVIVSKGFTHAYALTHPLVKMLNRLFSLKKTLMTGCLIVAKKP